MSAAALIPWIGNLVIIVGLWKIGDKDRRAFLWTMAGETLYGIHTFLTGDWAIFCAVLIFFSIAARNYWKWNRADSNCCKVPHGYFPATTCMPGPEQIVFHRRW